MKLNSKTQGITNLFYAINNGVQNTLPKNILSVDEDYEEYEEDEEDDDYDYEDYEEGDDDYDYEDYEEGDYEEGEY